MAKWNKKIGLVFLNLGLLTITPNPASADDCRSSCDPCGNSNDSCADSCFGGIEIAADFLYWKPCVDDLTYGASVSPVDTSTTGLSLRTIKYKNICPNWEPGFRITAGKDDVWCGMRLAASYTWINMNNSNHSSTQCGTSLPGWIESPLIHPALSGITDRHAIRGSWDATYQTWDVLFSFDLCGNRCYSFRPFFGLAGLIFDQSMKVALFDDDCRILADSVHMRWDNDYFGIGFKVGSHYSYQVCDGFSIFANASGTIVSGDSDDKFNKNTQTSVGLDGITLTRLTFEEPSCSCQMIPGYHLQLGIEYVSDMCNCETNIRIGWEYLIWHNISNPRRFFDSGSLATGATTAFRDGTYSSQANTTTFGFHGLMVGMDFNF